MLISTGGTVIRTSADQIRRTGRLAQGVNVMTLREGEVLSAIAPVVEDDDAPDETTDEVAALADAAAPADGDGTEPQ
jgi:hypothetical protein